MRMIVHRAQAAAAPFELSALKAHCYVSHSDDDALLAQMGRAAARELEEYAQIALITQTVRVLLFDPGPLIGSLTLPIGPVIDDSAPIVSFDGEPFDDFRFEPGRRPTILWNGGDHAPGRVAIEYTAGYGPGPRDIPADLAMAVMDQACGMYDNRGGSDRRQGGSQPFARIGARHRGVSL